MSKNLRKIFVVKILCKGKGVVCHITAQVQKISKYIIISEN